MRGHRRNEVQRAISQRPSKAFASRRSKHSAKIGCLDSPLYLRTGTGACPYDCVRLRLPSPVFRLPSCIFGQARGPVPTIACDCVSRLPSPVFRLPSCIFGQARGPVPTIACDCVFRLPSSVSRLPSSVFRLPSPVFRLPSPVSHLPLSDSWINPPLARGHPPIAFGNSPRQFALMPRANRPTKRRTGESQTASTPWTPSARPSW